MEIDLEAFFMHSIPRDPIATVVVTLVLELQLIFEISENFITCF